MTRTPLARVLVLALTLAAAGCAGGDAGRVTVLAASSLSDALPAVGDAFRARHPDVELEFTFAGTPALASQVRGGAPGDVVATADAESMRALAEAGHLRGAALPFATNRLTLAVSTQGESAIDGLADLLRPDTVVALAASQVPAGRATDAAFTRAGLVPPAHASREPSVRAVLAKVAGGEVDAGVVYETDVGAAGERVREVELPPSQAVTVTLPIAVLAQADDPSAAEAFARFVASAAGRAVLARYGFGPP